jgi:hypothetical protein
MYSEPLIITASTNRNLLQPTKENKRRRKSQIKQIQEDYEGASSATTPAAENHPTQKVGLEWSAILCAKSPLLRRAQASQNEVSSSILL